MEYKRENEEENIYEKQINDAGECEFYFISKSPVSSLQYMEVQ